MVVWFCLKFTPVSPDLECYSEAPTYTKTTILPFAFKSLALQQTVRKLSEVGDVTYSCYHDISNWLLAYHHLVTRISIR